MMMDLVKWHTLMDKNPEVLHLLPLLELVDLLPLILLAKAHLLWVLPMECSNNKLQLPQRLLNNKTKL